MKPIYRKRFLLTIVVAVLISTHAACGGSSETTAVTPVVSIPVAVTLPVLVQPSTPKPLPTPEAAPLPAPVDVKLPWGSDVTTKENFDVLLAYARTKGATPMTVFVNRVSPLGISDPAVQLLSKERAAKLRSELGDTAWEVGYSESALGLGMINVNLTEAGLRIMRDSNNVASYYIGQSWLQDLNNYDGRSDAVETQFDGTRQYVALQITLNVDGLEADMDERGGYKLWSASPDAVARQALAVLNRFKPSEVQGREAVVEQYKAMLGQSGTTDKVEFALAVSRQGLLRLAADNDIRILAPIGFKDLRPLEFDNAVLSNARKYGRAAIVINLRDPLYSARLSQASWQATVRARVRAFEGVFAKAGITTGSETGSPSTFYFNNPYVGFTEAELLRLRDVADARLLSVRPPMLITVN